jgi:AAA ATPase domain
VIVLLDEPGTSLHGEAQREFVDYIFNELGASKQTIYTTHSQRMVDPARYEKLRAVHDRASRNDPDQGVVVTLPNLSADRATILPIESALGYSVSQHLFLGSGQHLALEGSSDFVYLLRMTEHNLTKQLPGLDPRLAMIPIGGADNMPAFVALLGRRLKVSALIDGARSQARLTRIKSAAKANGVPESAIVLCSDVPGMPTNADIEDLFAVTDYLRLYNWAFGTNVVAGDLAPSNEPILKKLIDLNSGQDFDHALPAHQLTNRREDFFSSVDNATESNFAELFRLLNATL